MLKGIAALVFFAFIGSLLFAVHHYHKKYIEVQAQFDVFTESVKIQGEKALADAKLKEMENATKISDATNARDTALAKLRDQAAHTPSRKLSRSPTAPTGSSEVCLDSAAYNAALERARGRFQLSLDGAKQLAFECDQAEIDGQALLKSWPN